MVSGEQLKDPGVWRGCTDWHQMVFKWKDLASSVLNQKAELKPVSGNCEHFQLIIGCQGQGDCLGSCKRL